MSIIELREMIATILAKEKVFDNVFPLGNVVYLHTGRDEYELVIRTVLPDKRWDGVAGDPTIND